jgi:hypothetical protein
MAMNKQRRTSNINNVVTYNPANDVTVPLSLTQGFVFSSVLKADANGKIIGAASGTDFQSPITLTTSGNSGPSTFISNTLNIPNYTLAGLGGVTSSRTLTINSVSYDLSADRTWSISLDSVTDVNSVTTNKITVGGVYLTGMTAGTGALYYNASGNRVTMANYNSGGTLYFEVNGGSYTMVLKSDLTLQLIGYTTNGFLKTSSGNGSVIVDTTTYTPSTRNLTINGVTYDLSQDRTWTISATGMAIGGAITSATEGSVLFAGPGGVLAQDNANFFWNDTSNRLRINGEISINTTASFNNYRLMVNGGAIFGPFAALEAATGVLIYPSSIADMRLGIFDGKILISNSVEAKLFIDCGGYGSTGGQPVKIYTEEYAGVVYKFPLCLQGNGYETIFGQDTINTNSSSLVTMVSTTKGFLPPRMTATQRASIASPATGLIVYQTDGSFGLYVKNASAWQLLGSGGGGGGTGTVTSVSVTTANGFSGIVVNDTTTPAISIRTTVTGILKGNGTAVSAAVAGTDYQAPITLTTTGTSGAATLVGNTLNIPQYSGGGGGGGVSGSGTTNYVAKFTSSTAIGNSQIFDNGTNVGIGTASPTNKLYVSGTAGFSSTVTAAGGFFDTSDIRVKTIIERNPTISLDIDLVKYTKEGSAVIRYGYIAQEVMEVLSDVVNEGDILSLNYQDIHSIKIAALEKEIKELKQRLNG